MLNLKSIDYLGGVTVTGKSPRSELISKKLYANCEYGC